MKSEVTYARFRCDGCGAEIDLRATHARPDGWVQDGGRDYHSIECWWLLLTSRRVHVEGRGYLAFTEAAEPYLR